jgi:hypothetical protein
MVPLAGTNYKTVGATFQLLDNLVATRKVVISKPGDPIDLQNGELRRLNHGGYELEFEYKQGNIFSLHEVENVFLKSDFVEFEVKNISVLNVGMHTAKGRISQFNSKGFDEASPGYHRMVLYLEKSEDFRYFIEHLSFHTDTINSSRCVRVDFDKLALDIYVYENSKDQKLYLILDTPVILSKKEFSEYCFSALLGLGFVTGNFVQTEGFYFSYPDNSLDKPLAFTYSTLRRSFSTIYIPIYSNAFGYIRDDRILAEGVHPTLRPLSSSEFSSLCQWAKDSIEFSAILILIIESCAASLALMPAGFSVALESLTELLVSRDEEEFKPIKDKKLADEIRGNFKREISKHSSSISDEGMSILNSKIDDMNKLTNQKKLIKPFEKVGFALTGEDIIAIRNRNAFLHGRLVELPRRRKDEPDKTLTEAGQEIYYVSIRLYTLLSILILKSIGYDNKVVNQPRIQSDNFRDLSIYQEIVKEDYFRQI